MAVDHVLLAAPRGFCAGVEMAIKALAWMVRAFEPPVYCYHEIVHNQRVVSRFTDLGVIFVDDISEVPEGSPIMLSAHGSAPEVVAHATERGGYVVDSVCPLVTKVHHEVKVRAGKGYQIVYVGHEGHEEAVGTMAVAPLSTHRVESVDDVADSGIEPSVATAPPPRATPRRSPRRKSVRLRASTPTSHHPRCPTPWIRRRRPSAGASAPKTPRTARTTKARAKKPSQGIRGFRVPSSTNAAAARPMRLAAAPFGRS